MYRALSLISPATIPARRTGLNGIHKATDAMNRSAENIVNASYGDVDSARLTDDLVALKQHVLLFQASGKVVQASTVNPAGRLIDLLV